MIWIFTAFLFFWNPSLKIYICVCFSWNGSPYIRWPGWFSISKLSCAFISDGDKSLFQVPRLKGFNWYLFFLFLTTLTKFNRSAHLQLPFNIHLGSSGHGFPYCFHEKTLWITFETDCLGAEFELLFKDKVLKLFQSRDKHENVELYFLKKSI